LQCIAGGVHLTENFIPKQKFNFAFMWRPVRPHTTHTPKSGIDLFTVGQIRCKTKAKGVGMSVGCADVYTFQDTAILCWINDKVMFKENTPATCTGGKQTQECASSQNFFKECNLSDFLMKLVTAKHCSRFVTH